MARRHSVFGCPVWPVLHELAEKGNTHLQADLTGISSALQIERLGFASFMTVIAQISDLHLKPRGQACFRISETNMLAERTIRGLLALPQRPDAVVVTGDLANNDDPREYRMAREILGRLPMPVFIIPGNHDSAAGFATAFVDFPFVPEAAGQEKFWYSAQIGDLRLIALDSSVPGKPYGNLGEAQLDWLDAQLSANTSATLIAVHHPPIETGMHFMDTIGLKDADDFGEVIRKHSHVLRIMSGHVHRAVTASFAGTIVSIAPSTAHNSALDFAKDAPAHIHLEPTIYYLHTLTPGGTLATHTAFAETFPGPFPVQADEGVSWP